MDPGLAGMLSKVNLSLPKYLELMATSKGRGILETLFTRLG